MMGSVWKYGNYTHFPGFKVAWIEKNTHILPVFEMLFVFLFFRFFKEQWEIFQTKDERFWALTFWHSFFPLRVDPVAGAECRAGSQGRRGSMCREKVYSCMKEVEYKQFCREGEFLRTVFCLFFMQLSFCPGRSCCVWCLWLLHPGWRLQLFWLSWLSAFWIWWLLFLLHRSSADVEDHLVVDFMLLAAFFCVFWQKHTVVYGSWLRQQNQKEEDWPSTRILSAARIVILARTREATTRAARTAKTSNLTKLSLSWGAALQLQILKVHSLRGNCAETTRKQET